MPKGPSGVIHFWGLPVPLIEPAVKRVVAFVDGQNLYRCAKSCFGYTYPNYDVMKLAKVACQQRFKGCSLTEVRFYTGVVPRAEDPRWYDFWRAKLRAMGQQGIHTFTRPTRNGKEKGIDVRIAPGHHQDGPPQSVRCGDRFQPGPRPVRGGK